MIVSPPNTLTSVSESSTDWVINVEGISKKFCRDLRRSLFYGVRDVATDLFGGKRKSDRLRRGEFWALKDISFQIGRGEAVGLVGANGAGKSTLLRIISGLIKPDSGCVRVRGRLAPLIALGAGFNPILTGRENIYANMSILGLSTREIQRRFDEVVDFAAISEALDAPVQTYSSGMRARLGFACAIYVEPEILLIDEVLAVGDTNFRMKCYKRLAELQEQGTSFILVSHNPYSILNVCHRAIYFVRGQLVMEGEAGEVITQYEEDLCLSGIETEMGRLAFPVKSEAESLGLDIRSIAFENENGEVLETLKTGEPALLIVECWSRQTVENLTAIVSIKSLSGDGNRMMKISSDSDDVRLSVSPGQLKLYWKMPFCGLVPGKYTLMLTLREGVRCFDAVESFRFTVQADRSMSRCAYYQPRTWGVNQEKPAIMD